MKLMIVDDSNIIRNRISRISGDSRLPNTEIVAIATNGAEAIELYSKTKPDIITMDLTMPEMDGVECTKAIIGMNPEVSILIVSALSDKATAINALKRGAQGFLYKPFTDEELINALLELAEV